MNNPPTSALKLYEPLPLSAGLLPDLIRHQQLAAALAVACQLDLFARLAQPATLAEITAAKKTDETTTGCLLAVLTHAGWLTCQDGRYRATAAALTYFRPAGFLYQGHNFNQQLAAPGSLAVQTLKCLANHPDFRTSPEPDWRPERLRQIGVASLDGQVQATIDALPDLAAEATLLDLGGGHGFYSIALAQKYPRLKITLLDLPAVITLTRDFLRRFGLEDRITLRPGNFLTDDIGTGYDAVLCSNILHSDKRDTVLAKVRTALVPGGLIIVNSRIRDCADNLANALAKLVWQVQGGEELYDSGQWGNFLRQYGFQAVRMAAVHGLYATFTGYRQP